MNCPTCDYPMVYVDRLGRRWCSVYGDHRKPVEGRNIVIGARVGNGVIRVDFDRREAS